MVQISNNHKGIKTKCKNLYFGSNCLEGDKRKKKHSSNDEKISRQSTAVMSTQDMNIYDGILLNGDPSLTLWTSYNTRGQKTFGIDVTEYVVGFIERWVY